MSEELDTKDKRNFWKALKDPMHYKMMDLYKSNNEILTKRIDKDNEDGLSLMKQLNQKIGDIFNDS